VLFYWLAMNTTLTASATRAAAGVRGVVPVVLPIPGASLLLTGLLGLPLRRAETG
jgi:hypothetical protein